MKTNEDLMSELIYKTESGKHRPFQLLRNWREYRNAKAFRRTYVLLVASIQQSADKLFNNYCKAVTTGKSDIIKLLAYCTTTKVLDFYKEELKILEDMIDEYECYLLYGNWIDFLLGIDRQQNKLWDHRG